MLNLKDNYLKNFALFFVLLLPISLFVGSLLIEICLASVGVAFLVRSYVARDFGWLKATWVKAAIIFWLYISVRNLFLFDFQHSFTIAALYFRFFLFAIAVGYWLLNKPESRNRLFYIILITSLFISFNTLIQYIFNADLFGNIIDYDNYPRLVSPNGKLTPGMMLMMILLPVVSVLFNNITLSHPKPRRIIYALTILLFALVIFVTGERTPFIIFLAGIFLLLVIQKKLRKYLIHSAIILCLLIGGVYLVKPQTIKRHFNSTYSEVSQFSQSSYGTAFKMAWEIFKNHPIFGVGTSNFRIECQKVHLYGERGCYLHAHNIYLEVLSECGIIGFILFISMLVFWIKDMVSNFKRLKKDPFILGAVCLVVLKLLPFLSGPSINTAWAFAPFWLMLGIGYSAVWQRQEK